MALALEECLVQATAKEHQSEDTAAPISTQTNLISSTASLPSTHLPTQASLPQEMLNKLERQISMDSVGISSSDDDDDDDVPADSSQDSQEDEIIKRSERSDSVVSDGSEEGGRDSGIEAEKDPDMVIPDEDLMSKIVTQVEFYFSDGNVAKDKFLLKHIRRNKEGYVSLKLVSSFKKVKQLTKDWRVVAFALNKTSIKIQINDVGTKIRRQEPLPEFDETPVTCAILALNLPLEKPSIQSVSELFASCGEIAFIRVVRVGTALPQDIKALACKYPELNESHCAWVEFETPEAAKAATELANEEGKMKVVPILPEAQKKQEKQTQEKKSQQPNSRKNSFNNGQQQKGNNSRKNSLINHKHRKESSGSDGDSESHVMQMRQPRRKAASMPHTHSPNLQALSAVVEARRSRPKSKSCTEFSGSAPNSSWVQRHLFAAAAASAASAASPVVGSRPPFVRPTRVSHGSLPLPDGVSRFPKGPDGTRGFSESRRQQNEVTANDS